MKRSAADIFQEAIDQPVGDRRAYLDEVCKGDEGLRAEVESLLKAHDEPGRFLAEPTMAVGVGGASSGGGTGGGSEMRTMEMAMPWEGPGSRIGVYKLLQLIGEGGFGSVFMAEQERPVRRKVALKLIKLGMDTRQVVARFEQERQALAMMDHPNIARVLDAGATESGRPFFVMELVKGDPIVEYCDKNNLSIDARLELFGQVCQAVQHAHTKGIIHRDIKPSNILVNTQDGRPNTKVIDFGIAKATSARLTEKTLFTEHKSLVGTPTYMSPEQADGNLDIDTRTDVYSLGVLLYELLTGTTPFSNQELRSAAYGEIQRIIREVDPPKPSTRISQSMDTIGSVAARRQTEPKRLGMMVRGELDWIVMKALEKDRQRRYETANGLAMDIRRYLSGEAVVAAPPGRAYRFKKFVRRNRVVVVAGSAVAAALMVGVVAFAWQARVANAQRDIAVVAQKAEAEQRAVAVAAEAETNKRADQLRQVAEFQAKMLKDIDPARAGERLVRDIRDRFDAALVKERVPRAERNARVAAFAKELGEVNATDTAVEMIDRTILKPAITAVDAQFKDQPVVDASLRHTLAELYKNIGRYAEAASLQEKALATRRRVLGEDHFDTVTSINNLGRILEAKGDLARAEMYYREAVEKRLRTLGENNPETLIPMSNLGNFLREQGKFAEAEPLLRTALEGQRKLLGPNRRDTLISSNTYGYLLISLGKVKEAEPYWREAYETGKREFGPDDPDVLVWTNNMGGLLSSMGRHAESATFYREAVEGARRQHGLEHPNTLQCMQSYAFALSALGRLGEAEQYLRDVGEARRRMLGSDHPDTLSAMSSLGSVLRDQAKFEEAESILRDSTERRTRTLGRDHPSSLVGLGMLGRLYSDQGRYEEAEAMYREMLDRSKSVWSEDHPERLVAYNNLGSVLTLEEKYEEAEVFIRKSLDGRMRVSGVDHPETLNSLSQMARLREKQGKTVEAEAMYRDALERFRRVRGNDHPYTVNAVANLGGRLRDSGQLAEAESLYREAVATLERTVGKEHLRVGIARLGLGRVLTEQGRHVKAEAEMIGADRVISASGGVKPETTAQVARSFVRLYEVWDKAEPGKGYGEKGAAWREKLGAAGVRGSSTRPAESK